MTKNTNPLKVAWPLDKEGAMAPLRNGILRSVDSIKGDKERMDRLVETMKAGMEFAKAVYAKAAADEAARKQRAAAALARRKASEAEKVALENAAMAKRIKELQETLAQRTEVPAE